MKINPKCIDKISGHIWIKIAGFEVEIFSESESNWLVWDILKRDSEGDLKSCVNHVKLDEQDNVVYGVFHQAVVPGRLFTLRAAVAWVRFAVNEGRGFRYL